MMRGMASAEAGAAEMGRRRFLVGLGAAGLIATGLAVDGSSRRAVIVHGLGSDAQAFKTHPTIRYMTSRLELQGLEVDVPEWEGEGRAEWLAGQFAVDPSGASVRDLWLRQFAAMPRPDMLVGVSWGGLLALHAAAVSGVPYAALLPAADPTRLVEFAAWPLDALEVQGLHSNGYISWERDDERVGWHAARNLARISGCVGREHSTGGHALTDEVMDGMLDWSAKMTSDGVS